MGPTICVVTPTLNAERYLADCLASVRQQDWPHDGPCVRHPSRFGEQHEERCHRRGGRDREHRYRSSRDGPRNGEQRQEERRERSVEPEPRRIAEEAPSEDAKRRSADPEMARAACLIRVQASNRPRPMRPALQPPRSTSGAAAVTIMQYR